MKDFIIKNRNLFDSDLPSEEHFDNFLAKLEGISAKKNTFFTRKKYKIAAILIFMIFSVSIVNLVYNQFTLSKDKNLSEIDTELLEVKTYYENSFNKELSEFKELSCNNSEINKDEILMEIASFELNYRELKQELKQNGNNEFIINAMISNMQDRTDFLTKVISKVKENC